MRKIYLYTLMIVIFMACSPIEDKENIGGEISVEQLDIRAEPIVVNGKNTNKVVLSNHSPVLSEWNYGLGISHRQTDTVLLVLEGINEIHFTGLNANGTSVNKVLSVDVQDLYFQVPLEWGYLCGNGSKTWVWDNSSAVWGNGGYLSDAGPAWWTLTEDDIEAQAKSEGVGASMIFSLEGGANLTKVKSDGTTTKGTFSIDMTKSLKKEDGTIWSKGTLKTSGTSVLCGISPNENSKTITDFVILALDENRMVLSYNEPGTSNGWFWIFKAK